MRPSPVNLQTSLPFLNLNSIKSTCSHFQVQTTNQHCDPHLEYQTPKKRSK